MLCTGTHSSLSSKNASRKRKRFAYSEPQARLEELLLDWIRHHDATHGGKVPLSDMMILEQVSPRGVCLECCVLLYLLVNGIAVCSVVMRVVCFHSGQIACSGE
jgi:hypothetical protein